MVSLQHVMPMFVSLKTVDHRLKQMQTDGEIVTKLLMVQSLTTTVTLAILCPGTVQLYVAKPDGITHTLNVARKVNVILLSQFLKCFSNKLRQVFSSSYMYYTSSRHVSCNRIVKVV